MVVDHLDDAIAHAAEKGMGVSIMGPVAGGRLVTPRGIILDRLAGLGMMLTGVNIGICLQD